MKINLEVKKLGKFFFKSQKLLKRIGYYGYLKANKPIPFEFNSKTYFSNPDRSAINHIERSVQKISNLSNMIHFEPRVVFDVGANCGLFSAFVAEKYPNCNIFCFEPSEELIPIIKMNCNRYNVSIYDCAVSDTDGSVTFYVNPDSQQTNSVNVQAVKVVSAVDQILETRTVKCRSLDSIVEENKIDQVDVLKVDVQGFEGAVFRGGANMLKKVNLIFVESTWLDIESITQIVPFALSYGFTHATIVNPVLTGVDILLSKKPVNDPVSSSDWSFALSEELLTRRWW